MAKETIHQTAHNRRIEVRDINGIFRQLLVVHLRQGVDNGISGIQVNAEQVLITLVGEIELFQGVGLAVAPSEY